MLKYSTLYLRYYVIKNHRKSFLKITTCMSNESIINAFHLYGNTIFELCCVSHCSYELALRLKSYYLFKKACNKGDNSKIFIGKVYSSTKTNV